MSFLPLLINVMRPSLIKVQLFSIAVKRFLKWCFFFAKLWTRIHNFFRKLLYSGQNEVMHSKQLNLAENPNFALRNDTQQTKTHTHTHKHTHTTTEFCTLMRSIQNNTTKPVISVVLPKCFVPQIMYCRVQYSKQKQEYLFCPSIPSLVWDKPRTSSTSQAKLALASGGKILLHA